MRPIRKNVVTDENQHPVAVQIAYKDWLEIERALGLADENNRRLEPARFNGVMTLDEDPLDYQRRIRGEWS